MRIVRFPQTFVDLVSIAEFLGQDNAALALRFYEAYESFLRTLKRNPKIGTVRDSIEFGIIRVWFVRDFEQILIIYQENTTEIAILRVIRASRDYTRFI